MDPAGRVDLDLNLLAVEYLMAGFEESGCDHLGVDTSGPSATLLVKQLAL
jgi:hypothetical protein